MLWQIILHHIHPACCKQLDNIYAKQHADGFLSREIHESDGRGEML